MRFGFSAVDTSRAEASFAHYLLGSIKYFVDKYKLSVDFTTDDPIDTFNDLIFHIRRESSNFIVIIDEYDNFANKLFLEDKSTYQSIVSDKTAFFKRFFTTLKTGTSGLDAPVKRLFITGVTPMTMYDVTSGFNIGKNISTNPEFNEMTGFTEAELDAMLAYYELDAPETERELLREWYDNYKFSKTAAETVYNTDMILYYVDSLLQTGAPPDDLIDINVRSDYSKLRHLIYTGKKLNGNFEMLRSLIGGETILADSIVPDFSAFNLAEPENFISLLFFQGLLTIKSAGLKLQLGIPNETIKRIDIDYMRDSLDFEMVFSLRRDVLSEHLAEFALKGDIEVFRFLAGEIKRNTGIRDYIYNEACVKSMYLAYLSLTPYYVVKSELELNKGFADILLKPLNPYVEHVGMLEFKFFPRKDPKTKRVRKPTIEEIESAVAEASAQLAKYENDELVARFTDAGKKLTKAVIVFHGWELVECLKID